MSNQATAATITISGHSGRIFLDGHEVGVVRKPANAYSCVDEGVPLALEVEAGEHEIYPKFATGRSVPLKLRLASGQRLDLHIESPVGSTGLGTSPTPIIRWRRCSPIAR